ncbi:chloride channel protein [bacterium]|nr:chloride channel protein [bacterium]
MKKVLKKRSLLEQFLVWRKRHISDKVFMMLISVVIGFLSGLAAVLIKNSVFIIKDLLISRFAIFHENFLYFGLPAIGILIAVLFVRFILRDHVGHGIPSVLHAIGKNNGIIKRHNIFSSVLTSAFTVGFGGSVGLEGPTVATGAAIGSNLGRLLRFNYKQIMTLLALACAGAMAAIFKSPIAAVVFAVEVIMIDLTMASLVPLLIASVTAVLTSYFFLGSAVLYPFDIQEVFKLQHLPYYMLLGVVAGLVSVYFTKMYIYIEKIFTKINYWWVRWLSGGLVLGILIFFFPALYGEGYEAINTCLKGDYSPLYSESIFYFLKDNMLVIFALFILVLFFKAIATAVTFGAGGVGGIFAPTLFLGVFTGLFFAAIFNYTNLASLPEANFAMVAMGGLIAGVLHAPLTGIFLVAEITHGYELFIPLMIVATISYATVKIFVTNSVYTYQLARRGELITHHKDKAILTMLRVNKLIERDFTTIHQDAMLRELVKVISESHRNIYPVVDEENNLKGIIRLDDIRHIIFQPEEYDNTGVASLMTTPDAQVEMTDSVEDVVNKFQRYDKYNLPVLDNGKYVGFVSRANVFQSYRKLLQDFSDE